MLLASDQQLEGPDWYELGVPMVFADVTFEGNKVRIASVLNH
jgi:hypothetical protein